MTRKTLKDMTDAECLEAYRLHNSQGEGPAMISGYGEFCSYKTADAMIDKGRRLAEAAKPKTKSIEFNTGRKYSAQGQIIKATLHDDGVVTFMDHSRMVDGQFKLGLHCDFNQVEVMHWYDSGMAQGTARSRADGTQRGGCNAWGSASDAGRGR